MKKFKYGEIKLKTVKEETVMSCLGCYFYQRPPLCELGRDWMEIQRVQLNNRLPNCFDKEIIFKSINP